MGIYTDTNNDWDDGNSGYITKKQERIDGRDAWANTLFNFFQPDPVLLFTCTVEDRYGATPKAYWVEVEWHKRWSKFKDFSHKVVAFLEVSREGRPHVHGALVPRQSVLEHVNLPDINSSPQKVKWLIEQVWPLGNIDVRAVNSQLMTMRYIAKDNRLLTKWAESDDLGAKSPGT